MKNKIIICVALALIICSNALAQNYKKTALVINLGYPIKNDYDIGRIKVEKSINIAFFEIGWENYFSPNFYYSNELSSYNLYYNKVYNGATGPMYGKAIKTRIEPGINIWRQFTLRKDKKLDIGLGVVGRFDYDISLEKKESELFRRIDKVDRDIGFQTIAKHYFTLNPKNQLGILVKYKWFLENKTFDVGIGITYKHIISK